MNKKEVKPTKKRFFKALEQKKLEFWIETIYWLPKNEAREAAKNYTNFGKSHYRWLFNLPTSHTKRFSLVAGGYADTQGHRHSGKCFSLHPA